MRKKNETVEIRLLRNLIREHIETTSINELSFKDVRKKISDLLKKSPPTSGTMDPKVKEAEQTAKKDAYLDALKTSLKKSKDSVDSSKDSLGKEELKSALKMIPSETAEKIKDFKATLSNVDTGAAQEAIEDIDSELKASIEKLQKMYASEVQKLYPGPDSEQKRSQIKTSTQEK